jgi:hypothetical protein
VLGLTDNERHWLFALASVTMNETLGMPNQGQRVCLTLKTSEDPIPRPGILTGRRRKNDPSDHHISEFRSHK